MQGCSVLFLQYRHVCFFPADEAEVCVRLLLSCCLDVMLFEAMVTWALHTVKFELTNQHSVGGKNCGVLTSCRFCALRFDFCVISEVYTVEMRFYFGVFLKLTACLTSIY